MARRILDLCGGSGAWSRPYVEAGYRVELVTLPAQNVRLFRYTGPVHGILAAPPCTVFSYARNRYPPTDRELRQALAVVDACLRIILVHQPVWWALENPINKLRWFLGPPKMVFKQWEFGDPAHKPTGLWGTFTEPRRRPGPRRTSSTFQTNRENALPRDAITPAKFARAFFLANP